MGNTSNATLPKLLVQDRIDTNISSTHVSLGELLDGLDSTGSTLLELKTKDLQSGVSIGGFSSRYLQKHHRQHDDDYGYIRFQRTRLWRWMVYSRVTTSEMALLCLVDGAILGGCVCLRIDAIDSTRQQKGYKEGRGREGKKKLSG